GRSCGVGDATQEERVGEVERERQPEAQKERPGDGPQARQRLFGRRRSDRGTVARSRIWRQHGVPSPKGTGRRPSISTRPFTAPGQRWRRTARRATPWNFSRFGTGAKFEQLAPEGDRRGGHARSPPKRGPGLQETRRSSPPLDGRSADRPRVGREP